MNEKNNTPRLKLIADNPALSERLVSIADDLADFPDGFTINGQGILTMIIEFRAMAKEAAVLERAASPGHIRLAPGGLRAKD